MQSYKGKIKGMIPFPCHPKEKVLAYAGSQGQSSIKCPTCKCFAVFDYDEMTSERSKPGRGATHICQSNNQNYID